MQLLFVLLDHFATFQLTLLLVSQAHTAQQAPLSTTSVRLDPIAPLRHKLLLACLASIVCWGWWLVFHAALDPIALGALMSRIQTALRHFIVPTQPQSKSALWDSTVMGEIFSPTHVYWVPTVPLAPKM